jgi:pimeloyl-ACP methyl ester carboxylesterase
MQFDRRSLTGTRFFFGRLRCWAALAAAVALVSLAGLPSPAVSQEKKPAAKGGKDAPSLPEPKEPALPEPEELELRTGDNLQLAITYYPGVDRDGIQQGKGKKVIPIVLLHGWKQSRNDLKDLAVGLQKLGGYAIVVPDLRGHGASTRWIGADRDDKLDAAKMPALQFGRMVNQDMKAVKDFLWDKNNAAELNIDKLCVVGSEMGASVAVCFAAFDATGYGNGAVFYGSRKLGRFVKALVLISPKWSVAGLPLIQAMKEPSVQSDIAVMILVGKKDVSGKKDSKARTEAKQLYRKFEPWHPEPPEGEDKVGKQTLFLSEFDTSLQGTKLLDEHKFNVKGFIDDFVRRRLINSDAAREWTWKERKGPND